MAEPRTNNTTNNQRGLLEQVMGLARTQQFYWFLGHLSLIICFCMNGLEAIFNGASVKYYRYGLLSIIFTYVIVIKQIHFKNRASVQKLTLAKMARDENIQYFGISIWCYLMSFTMGRITGSLYSFNIYSVFHLIHYFQNNILNYLPIALQSQQALNTTLNQFSTKFNQSALILAANSEIFMLFNLVITSPLLIFYTLRGHLVHVVSHVMTMLVLIVFLKFRFANNTFTNHLFKQYDYNIQAALNNPQLHQRFPMLALASAKYLSIRSSIILKLAVFDIAPKKS